MKLAYVTTVYPIYLQKFYGKTPQLVRENYEMQKRIIEDDSFGSADYWQHYLSPLGYEVNGILANVKPLQLAWASENGFNNYQEENWILNISFEQIKRFKPDILFVDDYNVFIPQWIKLLRIHCPSIRLVLGWCSAPYRDASLFSEYDIVLSCSSDLASTFAKQGHISYHLNQAFDPRILQKIEATDSVKSIEFSFIGQILIAQDYHVKRAQSLLELVKHFNMEIFSPMAESANQLEQLRPFLRKSVFGLDMFRTLKKSQMTFNSHIDIAGNSASNMRLFEATGIGTCLITDWKRNLSELFLPDEEVVAYKSIEECVAKVKWLMNNPDTIKKIAQAGQRKTLSQHTFKQRACELNHLIITALTQGKQSVNRNESVDFLDGQNAFVGYFQNWQNARQNAGNVDEVAVVENTKNIMLNVKNNNNVFEYNLALSDKPHYTWPILSTLLWCAGRNANRLNIVDYGGSLGSSYYRNQPFLLHLEEFTWNIVEKKHFVECGKQYFEDAILRFYDSLDDCLSKNSVDVVLLSNVIQYLEDPYDVLQKIIDAGFHTIIVDRTPFFLTGQDRLTVQKVHPSIYHASYPAWFLNFKKFMEFMTKEYNLIADFQATEGWNIPDSKLLGFVFERKGANCPPINSYCTLFDSVYLTRGLVMYESLRKTGDAFQLFIVCFDDLAYDTLKKMNLAHVTLIPLAEFEDEELLRIKPDRSKGEYCWTCTSSVIKYCLERFGLPEVTYVDADLYFYQKPSVLLQEFHRSGCSVSLSPHNYSPVYQWQAKTSGTYCVQFMTFKADESGMKILTWWRNKCIEWCFATFDQENDRFGDQKYLDKWPDLFDGVHVLQNMGAGAAPWNIQRCDIQAGPKVDGQDTVFYHYHGFKWLNDNRVFLAGNYLLNPAAIAVFYEPYIKELHKQTARVLSIDTSFAQDRTVVAEDGVELGAPKTLLFRAFIENVQ